MISRGVVALVLGGATVLPSVASAVGKDPLRAAEEGTAYRFDWPVGKIGTMTYTHTKPIGGEMQTISVRYDVNVERDGSGKTTVSFLKPKLVNGPPGSRGVEGLMAQIQPPITVDSDGRFVATPPGSGEAVLKSMTELAGKDVIPPEARAGLMSMLDTRTRNFWNMLVGAFIGKKVAPDSTNPIRAKHTVMPGMPAVEVTGTGKTSKLRPCEQGSKAQCVEYTEASTISASDMEKIMQSMGAKLGVDVAAIAKGISMESVTQRTFVVTEPARLLPRILRTERLSVVKLEGKSQKIADVEQWEFSYASR